MTSHSMKLKPAPFGAISNSTKTIEIRLNDEKRHKLKIDDEIVFSKLPDLKEQLRVRVVKLEHFPTFREMIETHPVEMFGADRFESVDDVLGAVRGIYSEDEERKFGTLAIHVELIDG